MYGAQAGIGGGGGCESGSGVHGATPAAHDNRFELGNAQRRPHHRCKRGTNRSRLTSECTEQTASSVSNARGQASHRIELAASRRGAADQARASVLAAARAAKSALAEKITQRAHWIRLLHKSGRVTRAQRIQERALQLRSIRSAALAQRLPNVRK